MPKKIFWLLVFFGCLKILIHFSANANFGLHADELYYIALSNHLAWGYIDNAPFIAFITKISSLCFGNSTFAYRIFPTLFAGTTVSLTGFIAFRLGGKFSAIAIACIAVIFSPAYLAVSYLLQPVAFEQFFWTISALFLLLYFQTNRSYFLYWLSLVSGIGFLNKYTMLLFLICFGLAVLISKKNKQIGWKVLFVCASIFILIISPNLYWQLQHDFPIFHYLSVVKNNAEFPGFGDYLFQFTFLHAAGVAVWLAGLLFLLFSKKHKSYLLFSIAFLINLAVLLLLKGKIYYGLCAFTFLFAAGGVCWEMMLKNYARFWQIAFYGILVLPSLIAMPVVIPILPFKTTIGYLKLMRNYTNIDQPLTWENGIIHTLPQTYADMLGWKELSAKVEYVYKTLTESERQKTAILTDKYYIAGALSHYLITGSSKVISPNNSFVLWSPTTLKAEKIILISRKKDTEVAGYAKNAVLADSVDFPHSRINGAYIYLLSDPSKTFKEHYRELREEFISGGNRLTTRDGGND